MRTKLLISSLFILGCTLTLHAQVDWRFGFEDTWSGLSGFLNEEQKTLLLTKLQNVVAAQSSGGDINFPSLNGGWNGDQPSENAAINFSQCDKMVQLLQKYGFSMLWNLRINAKWASIDNHDCYASGDCAPDSAHEQDLYDYIYTIVERYDGDGFKDMGYETPDNPDDDLQIPIRFYLMTGEIEFAGAYPPPDPGYGDAARNHFWTDSIENLLRTHRIIYRAMHDADPTGNTSLISSGGVLWDLYCDFPDYPQVEGPTVQARLAGSNNHNAVYVESLGRLRQMLTSFGDDSDGIECDYIGWHPHMPWREVEQAFAFINKYAGDKPIYVDDMWCNIFLSDRADSPGGTLFAGGGQAIEGDFPNSLTASYSALRNGMIFNNRAIIDWYYARHARTIVKAFASVFGEGAERASISGASDFAPVRLSTIGFINIMGTPVENFAEKPGYFTYKLLVEKLHDFSAANEITISGNPLTRVYEFERPERSPVYVLWSETGDVPPGLDYGIPTGESVSFNVANAVDSLTIIHIVSTTTNPDPIAEKIPTQNGRITLQLGYEPIFLEGSHLFATGVNKNDYRPIAFELEQNYPNPFNPKTTIQYSLSSTSQVSLKIYDLSGREVITLLDRLELPGIHGIQWDGKNEQHLQVGSGVYMLQMESGGYLKTRKLLLLQ